MIFFFRFLFEMHIRDKDVYKISFATWLPIIPLPPSTASIWYKCWFCVPLVFQGVSDFCSDIISGFAAERWQLKEFILGGDSGDSINHLTITLRTYVPTCRSRFPVSVIIDDLYFRISWRVSTSLKAGQFGRIQWDSLKNKNPWNIHIQTTPLNSHAKQRRGRRDWNLHDIFLGTTCLPSQEGKRFFAFRPSTKR